jgi:hypothetical protein
MASVTVPTGKYFVIFSVYAQDTSAYSPTFISSLQCQVFQDGVSIDSAITSFPYSSAILQLTYPTLATVVSASSTLSVSCGTGPMYPGSTTAEANGRIQAIAVSSLSIQ